MPGAVQIGARERCSPTAGIGVTMDGMRLPSLNRLEWFFVGLILLLAASVVVGLIVRHT